MNNALLDANALIAAFDENHADHAIARAFMERVKAFYTCPQTQGAFLRFFTRRWTDADGHRSRDFRQGRR
jgi:predicted nucleic acid-binding protein